MEGRWTIPLAADGELLLWPYKAWPESPLVPVVPCDDAAIERVARKIREQNLHLSLPTCFERARAYLVAAGGTP